MWVMVLSVISLKGGVGKTSVVLGLASAALARDIPTLVIDLDPQGDATVALDVAAGDGDMATLLGSPTRSTLAAVQVPSGWLGQDEREAGRLDVVPGSWRTADFDAPNSSGQAARNLANAIRRDDHELVLIDCPPSSGALTRMGLIASDRAIITTEPGLFASSAADRALNLVQDLREGQAHDLQPLGVVVNRVRARAVEQEFRINELRKMFGPLILSPIIPERAAIQQAEGAGRPIHSWPGPGAAEASEAFDALLARVLRARQRR